ncbi:MAG: acyltransferase family protein [Ilumatobacteraceae bacterium]
MTSTIARPTAGPQMRPERGSTILGRLAVRLSLVSVSETEFRPDVEGLRAVAVVAVVLFHAKLLGFDGGFVGVDVFFVLSGFLITRLLLRELATTGTISLRTFWARRARRLLPASCLVLVVTLIAAHWLLPPLSQRALAGEAAASAGFVVNFVFADQLGDYFAAQLAEASPSPLLHFWSLAVEEQFYLVWPLLLVAATRRPGQYRRLILWMIGVIAVASFALSAWLTDVRPTSAFFLLPTRMGELLAGAALAAVGSAIVLVSAGYRAVLGWLGIAGIAVSVVTFDATMSFPGTATLLPVISTALVIVAGGSRGDPRGPVRVLRTGPMQWLGRHSYAIYLWHWPALVLAEARFGPLSLLTRLAIIVGSIGVSAVSVRFVESPIRHSTWLASRPRRGLTLGASLAALALIVAVTSGALVPPLRTDRVAAAPVLTTVPVVPPPPRQVVPSTSVGGAPVVPVTSVTSVTSVPAASTTIADTPVALVPPDGSDLASLLAANQAVLAEGLTATEVPANLRPSLATAAGDRAQVYGDGCVAIGVVDEPKPCRYGDPDTPTKVVLYGDSHAAQWSPPLIAMAEEDGFELIVLVKGGCPTAAVSIPTNTLQRTCPIWRDRAIGLIADEHPALVIVSAWSGYPNSDEDWTTGLDATMARLAPLTDSLIVLGDNPPSDTAPSSCLSENLRSANECAASPEDVVATGRIQAEQSVAARHGASFVDTTSWLCTPTGCPLMIGDILLYRDNTHLSTFGARWFQQLLEASLLPM